MRTPRCNNVFITNKWLNRQIDFRSGNTILLFLVVTQPHENEGDSEGIELHAENISVSSRVTVGKQVLGEYAKCHALPLNPQDLEEHMRKAAEIMNVTIVGSISHQFIPHGLTAIMVLSTSHFAIHTWPEYKCASVDIFFCSDNVAFEGGLEYLRDAFKAEKLLWMKVPRGIAGLLLDFRNEIKKQLLQEPLQEMS